MSTNANSKFYESLKVKSKKTISFKPPMTIFNNIQITLSPEDNLKFDDD